MGTLQSFLLNLFPFCILMNEQMTRTAHVAAGRKNMRGNDAARKKAWQEKKCPRGTVPAVPRSRIHLEAKSPPASQPKSKS